MTTPQRDNITRPPTVWESFQNHLPRLEFEDAYSNREPTGASTTTAQAPKVLIKTPLEYWTKSVTQLFQNESLQNSQLVNNQIPRRELRSLVTEADVRAAATLHLTQPINQLIEARFGEVFEMKEEEREPRGKVKMDVMYKKKVDDYVIAIIEYKAPGLICNDDEHPDFEEGLVNADEVETKLKTLEDRPTAEDRKSSLNNNARTFLKRVAAYARVNETRYVALFSWKILLLVEFDNMDFNAPLVKATGDTAKATWFEETDDDTSGHTFRKLLLGLMDKAFHDKGILPQ